MAIKLEHVNYISVSYTHLDVYKRQVMKDRDGYRDISRRWIQGWGQGLTLAFFSGLLTANDAAKDGAL